MNPRRRRQVKALAKELRNGVETEVEVVEVAEPVTPEPIAQPVVPEVSQAEIRRAENEASEQGVELEIIVGEEPILVEVEEEIHLEEPIEG